MRGSLEQKTLLEAFFICKNVFQKKLRCSGLEDEDDSWGRY